MTTEVVRTYQGFICDYIRPEIDVCSV